MPRLTTTLNRIRAASPCSDGWTKLLKHLGKTAPDDVVIDLLTILESNGTQDTLWCLRATIEDSHHACGELACRFAESVLHIFENKYSDDTRPREAIQAARDFVAGRISQDVIARAAAGAAAD